jgi:hypothetical protein
MRDKTLFNPINVLVISFSFPEMLCDLTDLIWREEIPFEAMTGRTAFIDGLLAEVSRGFPQL